MVNKPVLAMVIAACAACSYKSSFVDCEVACTESTGCPPGFSCFMLEGLCRSGATSASCAAVLDGGVDGDTDEDADGPADPCAGLSVPAACAVGAMFVCDGTCHLYCTDTKTWDLAKAACEGSTGWWLTEIDSPAEETCVEAATTVDAWIGLSQLSTATEPGDGWSWSHSGGAVPPAFSDWEPGQPNDSGGNQDCAHLNVSSAAWDDAECSGPKAYICERFP